ncbi:Non-specific serine/threonine protein kinase protein [Dioscorea alata]|uniref:Non-specific serine/threonine protein kinase protein n=1 Tax=Dioscorea alata TaxID=55571 RepID=A0ACB7VNL3_DIOAL|nr:Non-specific serine/threonine protein kinase protein [Dioscorea alata]
MSNETLPSCCFLLIIIFSYIPNIALSNVPAHICSFDSNYTSNSTFKTNLNLLFTSLISNTPATGFYNDTKGNATEPAYGLALCRGDVSNDVCNNCVNSSVQQIIQLCPQQKSGILWLPECILRYSNQNFFSSVDTLTRLLLYNIGNASEPERFSKLLGKLMDGLAVKASESTRLFAFGSVNFTIFQEIYGLLMCTRDLSKDNCNLCLRGSISQIPNMGNGYQLGGVVLAMSCYLKFEVYPFYNLSAEAAETQPPVSSPPGQTESSDTAKIAAAIGTPSIAAVLFLSVAFFCLVKRRARKRSVRKIQDEGEMQELGSLDSFFFDLAALKEATDDFSEANKLGEGGFGPVYKGVLNDGQEIAVKRLSENSSQGLVEMKNEMVLVAKLQHRNLVRLLGCCLEEKERLLVYEYIPNTSLDNFLFDPIKYTQLDWTRRYKIIEGVGRGLLYLHEDSRPTVIHRDLKASNILLDADMNPKISDFGLAKLFNADETQGKTNRIAGTYGYMAPEYALHGVFSTKSDVYSYGILVLEITTGKKNCGFQASGSAADLPTIVWQHWNGGTSLELMKESVGDDQFRAEQVLRCIHMGLLCVQEDPKQRPSMASIVLMLNSYSTSLPAPSPPTFYFPSNMMNRVQPGMDEGSTEKAGSSVNAASIDEIEPC